MNRETLSPTVAFWSGVRVVDSDPGDEVPDWTDEVEATPDPSPAHLTRTSAELLGRRALPRLLVDRPVTYVLGPPGVGKTTVARRLCGDDRLEIGADGMRRALISAARRGTFPIELRRSPGLLIDDLDFLYNRDGAVRLIGAVLCERAVAGLRTVLCQGRADGSITVLFAPVPLHLRASVLLRFPVGKGRKRYIRERAAALGVDPASLRDLAGLDPWSYGLVEERLRALSLGGERPRN